MPSGPRQVVADIVSQPVALLLSPGSTLSLAALAITLLVAAHWAVPAGRARLPRLRVWRRALFPRRLWRTASGRADIGWCLFGLFAYGLLFGWATLNSAPIADAVTQGLTGLLGDATPRALPGGLAMALLTPIFFLGYEFAYWLDHWLSHKIPFLWQFHRVHHSAESLSLLTNFRVHPVDSIVFAAITALVLGVARGVAAYALGPVSDWQVGGTNALVLIFAVGLTHLQHSHLWITFGPRWGKWLLAPGHHQIHHSIDPAHHDRNFGSALAIFDRLAGTLVVPSERRQQLTFGVDLLDAKPHGVMAGLIMPCIRALAMLVPAPIARRRPVAR